MKLRLATICQVLEIVYIFYQDTIDDFEGEIRKNS